MTKRSLDEQMTVRFLKELSVPKALAWILTISAGAFIFLIYLIYFREAADASGEWVDQLPALNAMLNSISAILVVSGYVAVRQKKYISHMKVMLTDFITFVLFFFSFLLYHTFSVHILFPGYRSIRPVYFMILISHIILSAILVLIFLTSYYFFFSCIFNPFQKVSKWSLPIWLYISVTGVMIFF